MGHGTLARGAVPGKADGAQKPITVRGPGRPDSRRLGMKVMDIVSGHHAGRDRLERSCVRRAGLWAAMLIMAVAPYAAGVPTSALHAGPVIQ